jgi:predicted transcriptional regulator of viral defense system
VLVEPYFFSFGTACTHHGLTEQVFSEVYIACQKRRPPQVIRATRYVFIGVGEERFFGFTEAQILGELVQMAMPERALLDAIDRPQHAGGLGEVSRMVSRAASKLNWDVLLDFLRRWHESALVQRLGYLIDLNGVTLPTAETRTALEALVRPRNKIHLGPRRQWGTAGTLARAWNIVENVPRDVLVERGAGARRRVTFTRSETPR